MGEAEERPTLLILGEGEPMEAAIREALERHGVAVESAEAGSAVGAVTVAAPDLVLLIGDAAKEDGHEVLSALAGSAATSVVPIALLLDDPSLDQRLRAFRSGAVAVVPRMASTHEIAARVAELAREVPQRPGEAAGELGDTTLDELVAVVTKQLRTGILSVESEDQGVRLVLGQGGPLAAALDAFVEQLKPLIAKAEPLRYELFETPAARLALLDVDDTPRADAELLTNLRLLLMDNDPARADRMAQALRAQGALVGVTEASARGLARARGLDPSVVVLDAATIEGAGFEAVRKIRRDPRLRWAGLLVAPWDEIWPKGASVPDIEELAGRIAPLVEHDVSLTRRAREEDEFDTRLELTGPGRMLRALALLDGTRHVTVRGPNGTVEVDIADGLIVGATSKADPPVEGTDALVELLGYGTGRVHIERRTHPETATIMAPVDQAIDAASKRLGSTTASRPPAPLLPPSEPPSINDLPTPAVGTDRKKLGTMMGLGAPPVPKADPLAKTMAKSGFKLPRPDASGRPAKSRDEVVTRPKMEPVVPDEVAPDEELFADRPSRKITSKMDVEDAKAKAKTMVGLAPPSSDDKPTVAPPPTLDQEMAEVVDAYSEGGRSTEPLDAIFDDLKVDEEGDEQLVSSGLSMAPRESLERAPTYSESPEAIDDLIDDQPLSLPPIEEDAAPALDLPDPTPAPAPLPEPPEPESTPEKEQDEAAFVASLREETDRFPVEGVPTKRSARVWVIAVVILMGGLAAGVFFLGPSLMPGQFGPDGSLLAWGDVDAGAPIVDAGAQPDAGTTSIAPSDAGAPDAGVPDAGAPDAGEPDVGEPDVGETDAGQSTEGPSDEEIAAMSERDRERLCNELVDEAAEAIRAGELEGVDAKLDLALRYDPESHRALATYARLFIAKEDGDNAVEWARRALLERPRAGYHVLYGDARRTAGDRAGAQRSYRRALSLDPNNRQARRRLGQ